MEEPKKLKCIDGIKAIAMVLVFNIHFLNAYYPGIYNLDSNYFHTKSGLEWYIGATPLNIIYAGKLGARIFLVVSAFLLARYFFLNREDNGFLTRTCVKKYFRLILPIIAVNILIVILMSLGAYQNARAAELANSVIFFAEYNQFIPSLWSAVKEAVWDCFVTGGNLYNAPLWFIYYEFWGTLLIAAILSIVGRNKVRYFVYIVASVILIRTDFLGMILGMAVADLLYMQQRRIAPFIKRKWLMGVALAMAFFFATYPSYGANLQGSLYALFPPKVLFYYNVAIPVILFTVLQLAPIQRALEWKPLARFHRISYCFYLVHFPVLCTLSALFFTAMYGKMNYHLLALLNYVLTFSASAMVAWVVTKWVDKPGRRMAEYVAENLVKD